MFIARHGRRRVVPALCDGADGRADAADRARYAQRTPMRSARTASCWRGRAPRRARRSIRSYVADPSDARSATIVYREPGSIASRRYLRRPRAGAASTRSISNRESQIVAAGSCLRQGDADRAEGRQGALQPRALLHATAAACYAISNKDSDVRRLVQIDIASGKDDGADPGPEVGRRHVHDCPTTAACSLTR